MTYKSLESDEIQGAKRREMAAESMEWTGFSDIDLFIAENAEQIANIVTYSLDGNLIPVFEVMRLGISRAKGIEAKETKDGIDYIFPKSAERLSMEDKNSMCGILTYAVYILKGKVGTAGYDGASLCDIHFKD